MAVLPSINKFSITVDTDGIDQNYFSILMEPTLQQRELKPAQT